MFHCFSADWEPFEIKRLSNGGFISNNYNSVTLFDESFKQLKKIVITGRAIHNNKDIYITLLKIIVT